MSRGPRDLSPEDRRIWARVAGTVTPPKRRKPERVAAAGPEPGPVAAPKPVVKPPGRSPAAPAAPTPGPVATTRRPHGTPDPLEPRRQRRLVRERDPIEASLDLHGLSRFAAEDALVAFLVEAQARGHRAVLVVTGQGRRGGGVIRASAVEWLRGSRLRGVVSGFAPAGRRHGGEGALYVTLRRSG